MPPAAHLDLAQIDFGRVLVDQEGIRRVNPQRFEMEHLNAIVHLDPAHHLVAGYKDVRPDEFWVRGHMPDYPLLPGVLVCEAAAQLCSYYCVTYKLLQGDLAEAWREGDADYATVAMRFSLVDKTFDRNNGQMIAGSDQPTEVTEVWTFVRHRGGNWELSAIQQTS